MIMEENIILKNSKKQLKEEIEQARRYFISQGRRVEKLAPGDEDMAQNVKPRKQRLKMFA